MMPINSLLDLILQLEMIEHGLLELVDVAVVNACPFVGEHFH